MPQTIEMSTTLPTPAEPVWEAVVSSNAAFRFVTRGMIRYPAASAWITRIKAGQRLSGTLWLFAVIPMSRHTIDFVEVDEAARRLVTAERGGIIKSWRHTISVRPIDTRVCEYRDRIDIDAGGWTPAVTAFARAFYAQRQRRWRQLAPLLDAALPAPWS